MIWYVLKNIINNTSQSVIVEQKNCTYWDWLRFFIWKYTRKQKSIFAMMRKKGKERRWSQRGASVI